MMQVSKFEQENVKMEVAIRMVGMGKESDTFEVYLVILTTY